MYNLVRSQKRTNPQNFQSSFFVYSISPQALSILCQQYLVDILLQRTFCDHILYITNVCRAISRVIKVVLLNNVPNES